VERDRQRARIKIWVAISGAYQIGSIEHGTHVRDRLYGVTQRVRRVERWYERLGRGLYWEGRNGGPDWL